MSTSPERNEKEQIPSSKRSLILDRVNPSDYLNLKLIYYCEQCSHFAPESSSCTIGYNAANHTQAEQQRLYALTGRIALCRFIEID